MTVTEFASRFFPPFLLMALIYVLSDQPDLGTGLGTADFILRKLAHMTEYGLLWWLVNRALNWKRPIESFVFCVLFAISDEWHQSFVAGRHAAVRDVFIDAAGAGIAWFLAVRLGKLKRCF